MLSVALATNVLRAKSAVVTKLEADVYALNNKAQYETAVNQILGFLDSDSLSNEDACYGYLLLSDTYKRIFDYDNVLLYLDKAQKAAEQIATNRQYYLDIVTCEKAFALFDMQHYDEAEVLMLSLKKNGYANLSTDDQAILIMQEGYLSYLRQDYTAADEQYNLAIVKMKSESPCNLPIIYGKKIALYGAMNDEAQMQQSYQLALHYADSCHIIKYNLYAAEIMRNTYQKMGEYEKAFAYFTVYDSLNTIYNADGFKDKLQELDVKYETNKKEQDIHLKEQIITANERLIAFLATAIGMLLLLIALYITRQRRKKLEKEKLQSLQFTRQLLNNIENERKRIATDLHDSVNNDLLLIKSNWQKGTPQEMDSKLDAVMNHVRSISRNLHPVLFEELGLKDSIEQLVERVQKTNHFILNTEIDYHGCLSSTDELQLYRIAQEAVSNMIKYSKAEAAIITLSEQKEKLVVEIKDNGKGFNVDETLSSNKAFGLHNIIERSKAINGVATITSGTTGTNIKIEIPIKK